MQAQSLNVGALFDAGKCSSTCDLQQFCHYGDGTIRLNDGTHDKCMVGGSSMDRAGPYQRRDLTLDLCDGVDDKYKKWISYDESGALAKSDENTCTQKDEKVEWSCDPVSSDSTRVKASLVVAVSLIYLGF